MAVAVVQEQQLLKTLRWYDGFVIALAKAIAEPDA